MLRWLYTETSKESHDGIGLDYRLSDHNPNPNKRGTSGCRWLPEREAR
jgi:hypothetical protein